MPDSIRSLLVVHPTHQRFLQCLRADAAAWCIWLSKHSEGSKQVCFAVRQLLRLGHHLHGRVKGGRQQGVGTSQCGWHGVQQLVQTSTP
jgi:hypothetical protein